MPKGNKTALTVILLLAVVLSLTGCTHGAIHPPLDSTAPDTQELLTTSVTETEPPPEDTTEDDSLAEINQMREDYALGTCQQLRGTVSVVLFYMNDFESNWTNGQITKFTEKEVEPGLEFLEKQALKYGVELNFEIASVHKSVYYDDEVIVSVRDTGLATIDVLTQAARGIGFADTEEMLDSFRKEYGTDEVVCFTIFHKNGTAYAINPKRGATPFVDEHCIVFVRDLNSSGNDPEGSQASIIAHEMLHLFGAEDFYASASRKQLARALYPSDIMLGANYDVRTNTLGKATAFYIGWTDEIPDILYDEGWG